MLRPHNSTMVRSVVLLGAVLAISACSSHNQKPVMAQFQPQYCHTDSQYTLKDGNKANSRVDVKCTDNPENKHFLAYSGMAKTCREHYYEINLNGKPVRQRGFVCKKLDGSWEIVHHPYN